MHTKSLSLRKENYEKLRVGKGWKDLKRCVTRLTFGILLKLSAETLLISISFVHCGSFNAETAGNVWPNTSYRNLSWFWAGRTHSPDFCWDCFVARKPWNASQALCWNLIQAHLSAESRRKRRNIHTHCLQDAELDCEKLNWFAKRGTISINFRGRGNSLK